MAETAATDRVNQFLAASRETISSGKNIECVIGNEAADLDSMQAAVLLAYLRGSVPVINIPRGDFKLRTEAVYLITEAGIDVDSLIFADEIDLDGLLAAGRLSVVLVDHNKLAAAQEKFAPVVTGVVDHHKDEGLFPEVSPRIIEPVGSVATLVAELMLAKDESLLDAGVSKLLLGTILLDTVNLDPAAERATPKDQQMVDTLLARTGADRQQLFDDLQREKFNVSSLGTEDLLRKDYKEWKLGEVQVGIGSVLLPIADWLKKESDLAGAMDAFASSRNLDVLIAMNAYTSPSFTRELVVYCPKQDLREQLLSFLANSDLQLSEISGSSSPALALYAQGNLGYSRKKLQPLLSDLFTKGS